MNKKRIKEKLTEGGDKQAEHDKQRPKMIVTRHDEDSDKERKVGEIRVTMRRLRIQTTTNPKTMLMMIKTTNMDNHDNVHEPQVM